MTRTQARQSSILCFGEALWDLPPGKKIPGGAPMNVALRLVALGCDVRLISRVGDDEPGRELLQFLMSQGLSPLDVQIDRTHATGCVHVDLSNPLEVRYDIVEPAAWDFIELDQATLEKVPDTSLLVFGSLAARNSVSRNSIHALLEHCRKSVFDVNLRPPYVDRAVIEHLLSKATWAKMNEQELQLIAAWHGDSGPLRTCLVAIGRRYDLDAVVVTLGGDGAMMLHEGIVHSHPGFNVPVVDTIGCGDSFLACWVQQMIAKARPGDILARACAVGALVATQEGANGPLTGDQITALINA